MKKKSHLLPLAALPVMAASPFTASSGAATLFADTFDRANNTDLNAASTGKSGTLGALDWIERSGGAAGVTAEVNNNNILLGETAGGGGGWAIAYPDYNFSDALIASNGNLTVTMDLASVTTTGNTRFAGFGVGNSLAELNAWAHNNPTSTFTSDFFMGYDPTGAGTAVGTYVFKNSTTQDFFNSTARTAGTTLSATFSFDDLNSGSTVNYEAFINGASVKTGSFTWSGTNENYIFLYSNYTGSNGRIDNFAVSTVPEPSGLAMLGLGGLALIGRRRRK